MLDALLFQRHLEEDEELRHVVHKHWFVVLRALALPTVAVLLVPLILTFLPYKPVVLAAAGWGVLAIAWWLRNFLDEFLDAWLITDHAVIDIEWFGWFHRKSTRILYSDIEGVSYEVQGISATLLRYGTLSIERISTGNVVEIDYVPRPRAVEGIILRSMEEYLHSKNLKDAKHVQEILSTIVAEQLQIQQLSEEAEESESVSP